MTLVNVISRIVDAVKGVIDGDITLFDVFKLVFDTISGAIFLFMKWFFTQAKDFFVTIGSEFSDIFSMQSFTDNWLLWILGVFIGVFVMKYIISAVIELISKFVDIT